MSVQCYEGDGVDPDEYARRTIFFGSKRDHITIAKLVEEHLPFDGDTAHRLVCMLNGTLDPKHLEQMMKELITLSAQKKAHGKDSLVSSAIHVLHRARILTKQIPGISLR